MNGEKVLDISWEIIFKIFVALVCFYLIYSIRNILVWFIFAIIISILVEPLIDFLTKKRIPKFISVIFVYFVIFFLLSLFIYFTVPLLTSEIREFVKILPQYFEKISPPLKALGFKALENVQALTDLISRNLEKMAQTIFNAIAAIFGGVLATLTIFSFSIFLSLEEKPIEKTLHLIFPKKYEETLLEIWARCKNQVSGWFLSRILGCFFVGILSYISFFIFDIKYPLILAILAGILDFLPIVGPILTGGIIFLVVILTNFWKAIFVLLAFILIQQIENNILLPALTKKFVGLPPVIVLFALAVGGILWGFWGAILAIPFFGILFEFLKEFFQSKKGK
jgi:predicted PurR-regulated permease PerM